MQADFKVYLILTGKKNPTTNFVFKAYEFWTKAFWIGCINEQNTNCNSSYHGESFTLYALGDSSQYMFSLVVSEETLKSDSIKAQQGIILTEITYLFEEVYKLKQKLVPIRLNNKMKSHARSLEK